MRLDIPVFLRELGVLFRERGKRACLVGGAVRDMLLGKAVSDYDIATDARPEELMRMFRSVIPTGIKHGTVTIRYKGRSFEATTFRRDGVYKDGRRPETVEYTARLEEDLSRRDFTVNAMALELPGGTLADPFDGRADLRRKLLRCVGDAAERFREDGLRPLRAVRFCARLGFSLDAALLAAIPAALSVTARVSAERLRDELDKTLMCAAPLDALRVMEESGLMRLVLPELAACRGVQQGGMHAFDVLDHSLYALEYACAAGYPHTVRLAALLHDTGKALGGCFNGERWTFYNHEEESARLGREILFRLRYPNNVIDRTAHLIACHMFHYEPEWHDSAVRRFIVRTGEDSIEPLFQLRRADAYAFRREGPPEDLLAPFERHIGRVREQARVFSLKDLAINGNDLIAAGITDGRRIGSLLRELFDAVLSDPGLNTREKLLEIAAAHHQPL